MKNIIVPVITFLIGAFVMHVWERYKSRVNLLNYEVWHQPLGLTAEDIRFGSVKVLYNEQPVNNLYMSTIYVRNESNKDIADIKLNIACDVNSIILVSYGRNLSSLNELSFTSEYQGRLISGNPGLDLYQKRDYLIPVINRGDTIVFTLLTSFGNFDKIILCFPFKPFGVFLWSVRCIKKFGMIIWSSTKKDRRP